MKKIKVLHVADIVNQGGVDISLRLLPSILKERRIDFCVVNGENAVKGKGINEEIAMQFLDLGVDVITGGNHSWECKQVFYTKNERVKNRVLRPLNYPPGNPGKGYTIVECGGTAVCVMNLQARTYMPPIKCPFRAADNHLAKIEGKAKVIIIDFHGEATAEKQAFGWYVDGRVSAVIGTHTHVQTADETILEKGTAYITDIGMTGAHDSVLGMDKMVAIKRFLYQTPYKYQPAADNIRLSAVTYTIDAETGRSLDIERLIVP